MRTPARQANLLACPHLGWRQIRVTRSDGVDASCGWSRASHRRRICWCWQLNTHARHALSGLPPPRPAHLDRLEWHHPHAGSWLNSPREWSVLSRQVWAGACPSGAAAAEVAAWVAARNQARARTGAPSRPGWPMSPSPNRQDGLKVTMA